MQFQIQAFVSQMVTMALPIIIFIALIMFIYLKRSFLSVLCLFIYLAMAWLFSYGFYSKPELWSSKPEMTTAILYGSAFSAVIFGFIWCMVYAVTSMDKQDNKVFIDK
jgi:energy-coupling factor transporter transmembrane protein EcfT